MDSFANLLLLAYDPNRGALPPAADAVTGGAPEDDDLDPAEETFWHALRAAMPQRTFGGGDAPSDAKATVVFATWDESEDDEGADEGCDAAAAEPTLLTGCKCGGGELPACACGGCDECGGATGGCDECGGGADVPPALGAMDETEAEGGETYAAVEAVSEDPFADADTDAGADVGATIGDAIVPA